MKPTSTWWLAALGALGVLLAGPHAHGQPLPEDAGDPEPPELPDLPPAGSAEVGKIPADWRGAVRLLRVPGPATGVAEAKAAREIFPDASKVWMHVHGTDPRPVEGARRGAVPWACSRGCSLALPGDEEGGSAEGAQAEASLADHMLRSIKAQTPVQPLPLTIWRPEVGTAAGTLGQPPDTQTLGKLLFDPVLLGRRDYGHVCAYPPVEQRAKPGDEVPQCNSARKRVMPTPDAAELTLGFQWPRVSELADFEYVAVTDTCGNAYVQPFQRTFTVPVWEVASGGCGRPDGRVLRVFPTGGWVRVTAFNLAAPGAGNVISATFRVTVPALEDLVSPEPPPLLFPDPKIDDLIVDCGPRVLKAQSGPGGIPRLPPGASMSAPPGKTAPAGKAPTSAKGAAAGKSHKSPPIVRPRVIPASTPSGQPLAHESLVISPEPLLRGNCRIELRGQTKRRLVAPLALRVILRRTDSPAQTALVDAPWIVTPNASTFYLPPLSPLQGFDGESRLRLEVYSDPRSGDGSVVLLSDAGRFARIEGAPVYDTRPGEPGPLQRMIGSVTIHSAPLCGESNFETTEAAGSCLRGYFTVPAMLATLQITRAPWVERPLITRNILSAVGVAFAMDSYDPVEREAFPVALQVGGFVEDLGQDRLGLLTYLGVAPTIPILGEGGNTTSIGLLGGIGMAYVANNVGPDEGLKPAAFLSIVVQVGQANPAMSTASSDMSLGAYQPGEYAGGTY